MQRLNKVPCCKIGKFFTPLRDAIIKYKIFVIVLLMKKQKPIAILISIRILTCIQIELDVRAKRN